MLKNIGEKTKKSIVIMLIIALSIITLTITESNLLKGLISYATEEKDANELAAVTQKLITNKVYEIEGSKKRIVQIAVETGINEKEYPIKTTDIELNTNLFNETLETVDVNYNNKISFTKGTWILNKENNKLSITLNNSNEEQTEKKEGLDKLVITYVYEYNEETETTEITSIINNVTLKLFSEEEVKIENKENKFAVNEELGEALILKKETNDIHKTKILDKTQYTETIQLNLNYKNFTNKIEIEDKLNEFYNNEGKVEDIPLTYKNTKINKESLLSIIGEEGKITIKDIETGYILMELNKEKINEAKLDEEEIIKIEENEEKIEVAKIIISENEVKIDYLGNTNKLKITIENIGKSERIIQNSILEIVHTKEIGKIENLEAIKYLLEDTTVIAGSIQNELQNKMNFKDTITKASVSLDNTVLYTNQENEVIFTITLNTAEEKTELYKNPVILVELPTYITNAKAGHIKLLNNNNDTFTIKQAYVGNVLSKKIALVALEGKQLEKTTEETNLKIELKMGLTVQNEMPEEIIPIKVYLKNNTVTAYEGETLDFGILLQEVSLKKKPTVKSILKIQNGLKSAEEEIKQFTVTKDTTMAQIKDVIVGKDKGYKNKYTLKIDNDDMKNNVNIFCSQYNNSLDKETEFKHDTVYVSEFPGKPYRIVYYSDPERTIIQNIESPETNDYDAKGYKMAYILTNKEYDVKENRMKQSNPYNLNEGNDYYYLSQFAYWRLLEEKGKNAKPNMFSTWNDGTRNNDDKLGDDVYKEAEAYQTFKNDANQQRFSVSRNPFIATDASKAINGIISYGPISMEYPYTHIGSRDFGGLDIYFTDENGTRLTGNQVTLTYGDITYTPDDNNCIKIREAGVTGVYINFILNNITNIQNVRMHVITPDFQVKIYELRPKDETSQKQHLSFVEKIDTSSEQFIDINIPNIKININVKKIWEDANNVNGTRPDSITVKLQRSRDGGHIWNDVQNNDGESIILTLEKDNGWEITANLLSVYAPKLEDSHNWDVYQYRVIESAENYEITYTDPINALNVYNQEGGTHTASIEVTNTLKVRSITVKKDWKGIAEPDNSPYRKSVKVQLKRTTDTNITEETRWDTVTRNNVPIELTLSATTWQQTVNNLEVCDSNGNAYTYKVEETGVDINGELKTSLGTYYEIVSSVATISEDEITITNEPKVIKINIEKIWADYSNVYGKRPASITVKLYRGIKTNNTTTWGNSPIETKIIQSNNNTENFDTLSVFSPSGDKYYYQVREVDANNNSEFYDARYSEDGINFTPNYITIDAEEVYNRQGGTHTTKITIKNVLENIDISGKVWLDGQTGIKPTRAADGYYDENNTNDKNMANIKVYLYKILYDEKGNQIGTVAVKLDRNNKGETIGYGDGYVVTDNLGMYTFNDVEIGKYYVEFEYDGINYKDTIKNSTKIRPSIQAKESVASEEPNTRTKFNNKFKTIVSGYATGNRYNTTTGTYNKGMSTELKYTLDTDNSGYKTSTLITMETRNHNSGTHTVVQDKFAMQAQTDTQLYTVSTNNINYGLVKKGMDLSLISNLDIAEVSINGKTTEYQYNAKTRYLEDNAGRITQNTSQNLPELRSAPNYTLNLYNSDYNFKDNSFKDEEAQDNNEMKVLLTYKIGIVYGGGSDTAYVNEIRNYYNKNLQIEKVLINNNNEISLNVRTSESIIEEEFKNASIFLYDNDALINSENPIKYITIIFSITKDNQEKINLGDYRIISEIESYSTENGGLVDCDSAPTLALDMENKIESIIIGEHEDDETISETLRIPNPTIERTLTGFVWDDSKKTNKGVYDFANGEYDEGENKVSGVKVQLIELKDEKSPYVWQETISGGDTVTYKKEDGTYATYNVDNELGEYTFNNFIPGDYIVRFIYGNGTTTDIKDINGNDMTVATPNVDVQDYKSTTDKRYNQGWYNKVDNQIVESAYKETDEDKNKIFNVARDNEKTRLVSMAKTIEVSRSQYDPGDVSTQTPNAEGNYNYSFKQISEAMDASTSKIYVAVDSELLKNIEGNNLIKVDGISDTKYIKEYNNINFGIEERPKTKLTIEKHLTSLKITANNGTTITDAYIDLDGELKGIRDGLSRLVSTRDDRGVWKLETDIEEVIQGAKLEAVYTYTITNNSETDYLSKTLVNAYNNYYKPDRAPETKKYTDVLRDANPTYIGEYLGSTYYTGIKTDDVTEVPSTALRLNDYINNELTYVKSNVFYKIDEDSEKYKIHDVEGNSIETVIKTVLSSDTSTETLNPGSSVNYDSVTVKKDNLSSTGNLTFYSYIAQIESYTNAAGRVDPDSVPGNLEDRFVHTLNPYDKIENDEFWGERIEIGKPTGEDNSINYKLIIAIVAGIGIIGIGAFVTKKHIIK